MTLRRNAFAVIVGIGQYQDPKIRKLDFAGADALAFRDVLVDPELGAFPPNNVLLLTDKEATLRAIRRAVGTWLFQNADPESTVVVFFAGHGGVESDKVGTESDGLAKYLIPWDADPDDLFSTGLANADFNRLLRTIKAKSLVVFLDACYAAGVSRRGARDVSVVGNPYDHLSQGEGRLVIASAQPNQRSWEEPGLGHGVFTHHILEGMRGEAAQMGTGPLSALQLFEHLRREVPRTARRLCNSLQEPVLVGEAAKPILLTVGRGGTSPELAPPDGPATGRTKASGDAATARSLALFDLHDRGALETEPYIEALSLLDKPSGRKNAVEVALTHHLDFLLSGRITPARYVELRAALLDLAEPPVARDGPPPDAAPAEAGRDKPRPATAGTARRYCRQCGTGLSSAQAFCYQCGAATA